MNETNQKNPDTIEDQEVLFDEISPDDSRDEKPYLLIKKNE